MLKLVAVSALLRRARRSPDDPRDRRASGTESGSETETESESESESETESEAELKKPEQESDSELETFSEAETQTKPLQKQKSSPGAELKRGPGSASSLHRAQTTRRRLPAPQYHKRDLHLTPNTARRQRAPQPGLERAGPLRPSARRLLVLAALAVLVTAVAVLAADRLRGAELLRRPRLTYGGWLARRAAAGSPPEPAVLYGSHRVRFNTSAPVHVRWPGHHACQQHVVRFAREGQLPAAALVTLPGSGATWLRHLIEGATGVFTSGSHVDRKLFNRGFYGQLHRGLDGSTVLQESSRGPHLNLPSTPADPPGGRARAAPSLDVRAQAKTVLLVQDPHRALLEGRAAEGEDEDDSSRDFSTAQWRQFVTVKMQQWTFQTQLAIDLANDLLVVHLEELQEEPQPQLQRVLQFLELTAPAERLQCLEDSAPPAIAPHGEQAFREPAVRRIIARHVSQVQELLRQRGHLLPLEKYRRFGDSTGGSLN